MKNYILTLKRANAKSTSTLVDTRTLPAMVLSALHLEDNVNSETVVREVLATLEHDEVIVAAADDVTDIESIMRLIGWRKCDNCHKWIAPQDLDTESHYLGNDVRLCNACYDARPQSQEICGYHGSSRYFRFRQSNHESMDEASFKGLGFELEIDSSNRMRNRDGSFTPTPDFASWNKHGRTQYQNVRFENDGSLENGFEIISQCMSVDYFKNLNLEPLFAQAKALGADDTYITSGLHWHFSKTMLGETNKEQALNFLKIMYFLSIYAYDFKKISGRKLDQRDAFYYCGFATIDTVNAYKTRIENYTGSDAFSVFASGSSHCGGASAFLIPSGATIEYRFFKSCTDSVKFRHIANLLIGITEHIKDVPWNKIYCMGKTLKNVPAETMEYFRKNYGAFLNTYATTSRGEQIALAC